MQEAQQNNQNDFMIEKIKERPVNKRKLIRRTMLTAAMAVIFGLIACFTFLILEPVISNWLYPENDLQMVIFPEDQEEITPEEMLADNMQQEQQQLQQHIEQQQHQQIMTGQEIAAIEKMQISEVLEEMTWDLTDMTQIYDKLSEFTAEMNQYLVTVTGVTSNVDWFNNIHEKENQASGIIIADNGKELLVLVDYALLRGAESLKLTFYNGLQVDALVKDWDRDTNLAVLAVELLDIAKMDKDFWDSGIKKATLGSSNVKNLVGLPVVALGRPMGTAGSIGFGVIITQNTPLADIDTNYKLMQTDILGSENAGGFLFNLKGQVIGVITNQESSRGMNQVIRAYGISELKKRIEKMSNGEKMVSLGIYGVDVTKEINMELGVPFGAYIKEIEMDSPAMKAGIQQGDILVQMGERSITFYNDYTSALMQYKVGDTVKLTVMRQAQNEYKEMEFEIVLEEAR